MSTPHRWLAFVLCTVLTVFTSVTAMASAPAIPIYVNGRQLFLPAPPFLADGHLLVPARGYLEAIGAQVTWMPSGQIHAVSGASHVQFTVGAAEALVNGQVVAMSRPAVLRKGFTYVPLRFPSERLAASVYWDGRAAHVTTPFANQIVVIDGPLNIRTGPSTRFAIIATVPIGTVLNVIRHETAWTQVQLARGQVGWVSTQFTRPTAAAAPTTTGGDPGWSNGYLEVNGECVGVAPLIDSRLHVPLQDLLERVGMPGALTASDLKSQSVVTGGRLLVSARELAEQIGMGLQWDDQRRTATVNTTGSGRVGGIPCNPSVAASGYVVMDAASGTLLADHRADQPLPIASTAKIMTALLALERGNPNDRVSISNRAANMPCTCAGIRTGTPWTLRDLVYGLILQSGNDAAVAIAEHMAGSESAFAAVMTERARELGAAQTLFLDASGLNDNSRSTARDLATIARHALNNTEFRAVVGTNVYRSGNRVISNTNRFMSQYPDATGVKNGWTGGAGYTLVASAFNGSAELITVVLGAQTRDQLYDQASRLMDFGFAVYRRALMTQPRV